MLRATGLRVARWGWPAMVSALCVVGACTSLVGAWLVHQQRLSINAAVATLQKTQAAAPRNLSMASDSMSMVPPDTSFLEDLKAIFKLAKGVGISLGVVEYKVEPNEKLPLTLRSIELKVKEDYPKAKTFLSQVLMDFPHAALQEIRIERADGLATQGTLLIRLVLVYKSASVAPPLAAAAAQPAHQAN